MESCLRSTSSSTESSREQRAERGKRPRLSREVGEVDVVLNNADEKRRETGRSPMSHELQRVIVPSPLLSNTHGSIRVISVCPREGHVCPREGQIRFESALSPAATFHENRTLSLSSRVIM